MLPFELDELRLLPSELTRLLADRAPLAPRRQFATRDILTLSLRILSLLGYGSQN